MIFAITGDSILNRRLSVHTEGGFLSLVKILRDADVAYTHLETLIHDYEGNEIYPAAEAGGTWMRSPRFVVDELKWAGFNLVSHASNHCLDYSYGGLISTLNALDEGGLTHAGTGRNLAEAREPAYLDTSKGRVALISMCSSFLSWARAGETRRDVKGRPGLNPLSYYYVADANRLEIERQRAFELGWHISRKDKVWLFNPPGLAQASLYKFVEGDKPGVFRAIDEDDAEGNIRSIRDAARQADYVIVHLHNHEWHREKGLNTPPEFVPSFAKACIDAGADIFIGQGSHAPLRGIEIYKGKPIFYDPGDFIGMSNTVTRMPADFYSRPGYDTGVSKWEATPADGFDARGALPKRLNPPGGTSSEQVVGSVVALYSLDEEGKEDELKVYPITMIRKPRSKSGISLLAEAETAKKIVGYLQDLSAPFHTEIELKDGVGFVKF